MVELAMLHKLRNLFFQNTPLNKAELVDLAFSHLAEVAYSRLAQRGFRPNGIIDIGAFRGDWSRTIARVYPNVPILMIEARAEQRARLERACAQLNQAKFELALLGDKEGIEANLEIMGTGSSLYSERSNAPRTQRTLTMHTLDKVIREHPQLKTPLFMKLDVQGAELDVLNGGPYTLALAEVVQLEVALMHYNEGAPNINSVLEFMSRRGFALFDICGFIRPIPAYLSQLDVLFVRRDSKLRTDRFVFSQDQINRHSGVD